MALMALKKIADSNEPVSLALKMRKKRFSLFLQFLKTVPKPLKILDVGGTQSFWKNLGFQNSPDVKVVLLNLKKEPVLYSNFTSIVGDATNMSCFKDNEFDVVFSNSVIEHVGSLDDQRRMATEIRRVGRRYFVQTPNYYFPIEPHFLFPLFQFIPISSRIFLLMHFNLGWYKKVNTKEQALKAISSIRLLTKTELLSLFPNSYIYEEKFFGLTKSFIAYSGWDRAS